MNKFAIISLCLFGAVPMMATAQQTTQRFTTGTGFGPIAGDQELIVSGNGSMAADFDGIFLNGSADWGWYLQDGVVLGARQKVNYADSSPGDAIWNGATQVYADWVFNMDTVRPFLGANAGLAYGDGAREGLSAGLEGGSKFYVQEKTFINARAEYQWLFDDDNDDDVDVEENSDVALSLGVGYNF